MDKTRSRSLKFIYLLFVKIINNSTHLIVFFVSKTMVASQDMSESVGINRMYLYMHVDVPNTTFSTEQGSTLRGP